MTATEILAVVGAVTGCCSAAAQATAALRDRPRLQVAMGFDTAVGKPPTAWIDVYNEGTRPSTVREVGFFAGTQHFATSRGVEGSGPFKTPVSREPIFLEAGKSIRLFGNPDSVDAGFPADFPLRPYAVDLRRRYVWGNAGPVVRWLVGDDPPLTPDDPPDFRAMFEPRTDLLPEQIEPRWKLWKARDRRRPEAWPRMERARGPVKVHLQYARSNEP